MEDSSAQQSITVEDAVLIGLENNYGILIARNESEAGAVNRSLGNAGFLPTLDVSGSQIRLNEYARETMNGVNQGREFIGSELYSIDISLGWTLFDGLRMFTSYNRLSELRDLGETEARIQIEFIISEIISGYYNIVRQQNLLEVLENSIEVSEERVRIAETKRELGSGSEYEILLALADLNTDKSDVVRQQAVLNDAKLNLIRLISADIEDDIQVENGIELDEILQFEDLYGHFLESNSEIRAADISAEISRIEVNEVRSERFPELELNVGYGAMQDEIRNSGILLNELYGMNFGLTARINLFDGFNTNRRVQLAKIEQRNSELAVQDVLIDLETRFRSEFKNYESTRELVELETENISLAEQALEIAIEQFRLATITSIELRETQNILFDTENRLIAALYESKLAETELLRLSGLLGIQFEL